MHIRTVSRGGVHCNQQGCVHCKQQGCVSLEEKLYTPYRSISGTARPGGNLVARRCRRRLQRSRSPPAPRARCRTVAASRRCSCRGRCAAGRRRRCRKRVEAAKNNGVKNENTTSIFTGNACPTLARHEPEDARDRIRIQIKRRVHRSGACHGQRAREQRKSCASRGRHVLGTYPLKGSCNGRLTTTNHNCSCNCTKFRSAHNNDNETESL